MGNVIYSISADMNLKEKAELWESGYKVMKKRRWNDDVNKMNEALSKEGLTSSIIEVYSPKRVNGIGELMGLAPGMSLDLTENDVDGLPWDFNNPAKRAKAEQLVRSKKALLLIGSPMCSAFSQIQGINFCRMSPTEIEKVLNYGRTHLEFCAKLYKLQHENGLYFLHEHPYGAKSWQEKCITELLALEGVVKVKSHMCAFGMMDSDHQGGGLVKKATGWMTNAVKIGEELERPCSGDHRHVVLIGGGRAKRAQVYPGELCKAIIFGLRNQMVYDGRLENGLIGAVTPTDDLKDFVLKPEDYENFTFYDDVSGKELPKELSLKARQTEMKQVYAHKVYYKVPIQ